MLEIQSLGSHLRLTEPELQRYQLRYLPILLLVFQAIERLVESHIIPFNGGDLVVSHPSKGINQVSTEAGVDVVRLEPSQPWPVLGPVGEVAYQLVGRT